MKIAYISTFYGANLGGAEISVQLLSKELSRRGFLIQILSREKVNEPNIITIPLLNIIPRQILKVGFNIVDKLIEYAIKSIIKKNPPDLIHVQDIYLLSPLIGISKKFNIPIIATVRDPIPKKTSHNYNLLTKIVVSYLLVKRNKIWIDNLKRCDKIIAISNFIKKRLVEQGIHKEKIIVIYNIPPDWNRRRIIGNKAKTTESLTLFTACRLYQEKGINTLLDAISIIINMKKEVKLKLLIAGDGPDMKNLKKRVEELQLKSYVKLLGKVSYEAIEELYYSSDVVTLLSEYPEPFGRVILEGMASGKPVIGTDIGGIPELIIDGKNGFLVPPRNSQKTAEVIIKLLESPELIAKMGREGYEIMKARFNSTDSLKQHIETYEALINEEK